MPKLRKKISNEQSVSGDCTKKKLSKNGSKIRKPKKRSEKSYTKEALEQAITAAGGNMSLTEAARQFGVPKSTLSVKMRHLIPVDCKKGPSTVLTNDEEADIVNWILFCAEKGFPVNKSHLLDCVQNYLTDSNKKNPFTNNRPGKHWYTAFMKRHPALAERIAQNLTSTRASVTEKDLRAWFNRVQLHLQEKNLFSVGPTRIFNLDESSFMLVPKDDTVLTKKGAKAVYQIVSASDKACITTLITASASGEMAPPMVMFDCKTTPNRNILRNIPKGWGVGHTESGWMSSESFYDYIKNVFFKWLKDKGYTFPVILYVDGHSSHCTLPLVKFCKDNGIELMSLYPNATHIIQPLDVALFRPLKESYSKALKKYRVENNIVDVKKWMFASVLKSALEAIDFTNIVKSGFRACGLYPFNPNAVDYNILNKASKKKNVSESSEQNTSVSEIEMQKKLDLLKMFESDLISPATLESFKTAGFDGSWNGEIEQQGVYECWKKLNQLCGASVSREECLQETSMGEVLPNNDNENNCFIDFNENNVLQASSVVPESDDSLMLLPENEIINIESSVSDKLEQENSIVFDLVLDSNISVDSIDELDQTNPIQTTDAANNVLINVASSPNIVILSKESVPNDIEAGNPDNPVYGFDEVAQHPIFNESCDVISLPKRTFMALDDPKITRTPRESWLTDIQNIPNECEVLDLSSHSSAPTGLNTSQNVKSITMDTELSLTVSSTEKPISNTFEKAFQKPCFENNKKRKKRMRFDENTPISCTVDDMLDILEKKDCAKRMKVQESEQKKINRAKIKALKNEELNMKKKFNEKKRLLSKQKKDLNLKIKNIKKLLKTKNELSLQDELKNLECQLDNLEQSIKIEELTVLQKTLHIKKKLFKT